MAASAARAGLVERNVAELVQNNDVEAVELGELAGQPALLLRFDEQRDQLGRGHEPHPVVMLAAGHPQGDGQMRLPGADSADEHDVGGVGDEAAVEDLQDRIAVEVGLRLEREGVQRLQHREAGILDAALPASGHLQVHQLRQVVGRRLSLAGGLLGEQPPLRPDRRQAQRLQVRRQMRGLDNRGRHQQEPSTSASYADSFGVGTAIRASSGRTPATGGHTGGGPACC